MLCRDKADNNNDNSLSMFVPQMAAQIVLVVGVAVAVSTQRELQKIRRRSERRRQEPDGRFDASQGFASLTLRVVGVVVVVVVIKQLVLLSSLVLLV